jgi:uroporphyrinogen-III decarboxylase
MTERERMLAAIRGEPTDRIPWAPRMDLWYIALRGRGSLPQRFVSLDTAGIADELGVGCHAVRADYTRPRPTADLVLRGLGLDNHPDYPFRTELRGLDCTYENDGENFRTTIRTPGGEVITQLRLSAAMARDGISLPFVEKHAIESLADFEPVAQVFEHLEVVPTPANYTAFHHRVGERGLAVASGPLAASPVHLILHELAPMDRFFYLYADHREEMQALTERMRPYFEQMLEALVGCDAELLFWGANYDQDLTWPPFFAEEIAPWLQRVGERAHAAGKFLLTHTDGENRALLPQYPACNFDVAESVCPAPMTSCSLAEVRAGMGPTTTVWGGIPSVALLPDSMDDGSFANYLDELFAGIGSGEKLILGVSDNVPPDADMERMERIRERIEDFGPVTPGG